MVNNDTKFKVFSGLGWKFGERFLAQSISLIVSIILARILSTSDYGAIALIMIFISFANVFVSNGFGKALVQKKDADNLDFSSVFYINLFLSFILYLIIYILAPFISNFFTLPILKPSLRVFGIVIIIGAINSIQHAYVERHMLFKRFFWSTLFGTLLSGIVGVWMAFHGFGIWSLITQYMTNTLIDTVILWFTVKWRPEKKYSWQRTKVLFSFGWKLLLSSLLDTGYNQLRSILIGKIYTKEDLAHYDQGDKYPSLIVTNINSSISSVLFPALSNEQSKCETVKSIMRRAIQVSSYIMWPMMIGLAVCAETLIRLVLTDKWLPCVPFLRVFCLCYGLWPIHTANLQAINAMGRSDIFLKLEIIKKIIGIIALLITIPINPFAISIGLLISGFISAFINAYPNIKLLDYKYSEQIKDVLPPIVLSVLMGAVVYILNFIMLPDLLKLFVQVFAGIFVYVLLSIISKQESFLYIINIVKYKLNNKKIYKK